MPALWSKFEIEIERYVKKGTARTHNDFSKKLAKEYSQAIIPIQPKYSSGPILQPVLNAKNKRSIIEDHFTEMFDDLAAAGRKAVPKDFRKGALGIIKYWTPGIGVMISPFPAPFNAFAPLIAGSFVKQKDWDDAMKNVESDSGVSSDGGEGGTGLYRKAMNSSVEGDPLIILPSPIVLMPGVLSILERELYDAFINSQEHGKFAKNLAKACKNHLSTVSGIYLGFRIPNTAGWPIPIVIIPFNGIS